LGEKTLKVGRRFFRNEELERVLLSFVNSTNYAQARGFNEQWLNANDDRLIRKHISNTCVKLAEENVAQERENSFQQQKVDIACDACW